MNSILLAPDSFKGSLTALEAARAMTRGIHNVFPNCKVMLHPVSDGGEGLVSVLCHALRGEIQTTKVQGPLPGQHVQARWGIAQNGMLAIIEMAEAAGLNLVPRDKRDPKHTTTVGVGELLRVALDHGVQSIIIGIGGSATNDGGAGMVSALGARFFDHDGYDIPFGGAALAALHKIDTGNLDARLNSVSIMIASDVQNTLCGNEGASSIYGPQKGATKEDVLILDEALMHYAAVVRNDLGLDVLSISGGGAAGGLGAGLIAFCGAKMRRGIDVVLDVTGFDERVCVADLVITGEGRLDEQVFFGKAVSGVVERAQRSNVPVAAIVGSIVGERDRFVNEQFLCDVETLVDERIDPEQAMKSAAEIVSAKTEILLHRMQR
ncbi:MAG: glycerate kinase [bacterium]